MLFRSWGVNVTVEAAKDHLQTIARFAEEAGRDPKDLTHAVSPGIGVPVTKAEVEQYAELGVDQVIVGAFAESADEYRSIIEQTAEALIA